MSATAVYDFSPVTGVEEVEKLGAEKSDGLGARKVLRNGQLLIEKLGQWYNTLGYRVAE